MSQKPETLATDRPLYSRQPKETTPAWEAFVAYRDARTDRSLRKTAEQIGKSDALLFRWSSRWRWQDRVAAFDDHEDAVRRKAAEAELRKMGQRQGKEAALVIGALVQPSAALLQKLQDEPGALKEIPAYDLGRLAGYAARVLPHLMEAERIARGAPGRVDRSEVSGPDGAPIETKGEVHLYLPDNGRGKRTD